ncbi:guanylate cyclase domain-containing protein, partial [Haematococcus lacustris]
MVSAVTAAKAASAASKPPHVAASRPMASPWATVSAAMAVNSKPAAAKEHVVIPAGLRLKIGIDVSSVSAELGATTGTINYRGKVLNRAARIAMQATPGKVLCSARAWRRSMEQAALLEAVGTMSPVYVNGRAITAI